MNGPDDLKKAEEILNLRMKYPWPEEAKEDYNKNDRLEFDEMRCGPVLLIEDEWQWCNKDNGSMGHIQMSEEHGDWCTFCGSKVN